MPEIITCPDCGRKLRVPDELVGKKVKCPDCKVKFTGVTASPNGAPGKSASARKKADDDEDRRVATAPGAKKRARATDEDDDKPSSRDEDDDKPNRGKKKRRDDDEDEDHPRRRSRYEDDEEDGYRVASGPTPAEKRAGWKMVLTGLNLLVYATYVFLATIAVALLSCALMALIGIGGMSTNNVQGMGASMASVGVIGMLMYGVIGVLELAMVVLQVTGHGFCMGVPHKAGTPRKGFAIAAFSCACGVIVTWLMSCGLSFAGTRLGTVVAFLPMALSIGWFVCYFLFLRSVAVSMREPGLAQQCVFYMIAVPVMAVLMILMYVVMIFVMGAAILGAASANSGQGAGASVGAAGIFGMLCGLLFFALEIAMIVWYIMIVHQVRNAVRNYVE